MKSILITGATNGIGKALVLALSKKGNYKFGIDEPSHPLISIIRLNDPKLRSKFDDERYDCIALKDEGMDEISYGRNSYDFENGTMMFLKPKQVIAPGNQVRNPEAKGWMLFFHPDLIRKSGLKLRLQDYHFFSYGINEGLHLSPKEQETLTELTVKIEEEYNQNIDKHSQNLIISTLELLLNYCTRYYDRQFFTRTNLNQDIVVRFNTMIKEYYKSDNLITSGMPTVQSCAEHLNLSPQYLSDLLRKETGKSTKDHIHDYIVDNAKETLLNSNLSVNEIAYNLGFEYPQYFSRMFKKKTNMTPTEFRYSKN